MTNGCDELMEWTSEEHMNVIFNEVRIFKVMNILEDHFLILLFQPEHTNNPIRGYMIYDCLNGSGTSKIQPTNDVSNLIDVELYRNIPGTSRTVHKA